MTWPIVNLLAILSVKTGQGSSRDTVLPTKIRGADIEFIVGLADLA